MTGRSREERRVGFLALASALILAAVAGLWAAAPARAPRVTIRWGPQVPARDRAALEARFRLLAGERRDRTTWSYDMGDPSQTLVTALVGHPAVEDTGGIDRARGIVSAEAERGSSWLGSAWLGALAESRTIAWISVWCCWSAVLSAAWLLAGRSARRRTSPHGAAPTRPAR
jgi:hypothetical protein